MESQGAIKVGDTNSRLSWSYQVPLTSKAAQILGNKNHEKHETNLYNRALPYELYMILESFHLEKVNNSMPVWFVEF